MWPAQDDVKAVRAEARERAEAADRLKIKYDYMIKSLGGGGEGKEDKKSEEGKEKASNLSARYSEQIKLNIGCVNYVQLTHPEIYARLCQVASHAYHLVCLAQEKAETQDKIDELLKRLAVEETELEGLHSAVALMKNSNVKYRDG